MSCVVKFLNQLFLRLFCVECVGTFRSLLLVGGLLAVESLEECFKDLNTFQCSCIDQKGYTPFWTDHNKINSGKWTASVSVTDDKCSEQDAIKFLNQEKTTLRAAGRSSNLIVEMVSKGYMQHGRSLYKAFNKGAVWDNARRICINEGSHLAIPNSDDEFNFLLKINPADEAFIGMNDIFNEAEHVTIFGEPATIAYKNFDNVVQLSNTQYVGLAGEDCMTVSNKKFINDVSCSHNYGFICEIELDEYPPERDINYNNGPYKGIESSTGPPNGKVKRTVPPAGYEYHPGFGFYRFHTTPEKWEFARHVCEMEGGHLAIINSIYEHNILQMYFEKYLPKRPEEIDDNTRAHIGFHDLFEEGRHVTLFDQTLEEAGFSEWFEPGQPDNRKGENKYSDGENCGVIHRDGGIDDFDCDKLLAYFCEQELYE